VIVDHATTRHKLQGKTVKSVVIAEWLKVKDWAYVVLSCVKTLCGLFLMSPIPEDIDFGPAEDNLDMMQNLRQRILATMEEVSELEHNFSGEVKLLLIKMNPEMRILFAKTNARKRVFLQQNKERKPA
jgi:hypothetical protein